MSPDNLAQAMFFLDMLDPGGRHTIASEAPFGGIDGGPKWEIGCTYEAHQRDWLIEDIPKATGSRLERLLQRQQTLWRR